METYINSRTVTVCNTHAVVRPTRSLILWSRTDDLYLRIVSTSAFPPADVNVQVQQGDPHSLLEWVRGMLEERAGHTVVGRGSFEPVGTDRDEVLAFLRQDAGEAILVVANLSGGEIAASLDLPPSPDLTSLLGNRVVSDGQLAPAPYGYDWIGVK